MQNSKVSTADEINGRDTLKPRNDSTPCGGPQPRFRRRRQCERWIVASRSTPVDRRRQVLPNYAAATTGIAGARPAGYPNDGKSSRAEGNALRCRFEIDCA